MYQIVGESRTVCSVWEMAVLNDTCIFCCTASAPVASTKPSITSRPDVATSSNRGGLFDDDEEEDLFALSASKPSTAAVASTKKGRCLFEIIIMTMVIMTQ